MKALFLDIDGVICLDRQWGSRFKNKDGLDSAFDRFDDKAVKILNEIISKTDCEIIISSDWRFDSKLETLQELFRIRNVLKVPFDYTTLNGLDPSLFKESDRQFQMELEQTRALEICDYLKSHPEIIQWVAIDDLDLRKYVDIKHWNGQTPIFRWWGIENFVWTPKFNEGIKQCGIKEKVLKFLL